MPQTVPNSPTNGAVEPTVAKTAKPSCMRLCTWFMARWMLIVTQVLKSTAPNSPVCLLAPSSPFSAIKRKGLSASKPSAPCCTVPAFQNEALADWAKPMTRFWSISLVKITYQLDMLISTKISNVALATQSPCAQTADKPYGLSKVSSAA